MVRQDPCPKDDDGVGRRRVLLLPKAVDSNRDQQHDGRDQREAR